MSPKTLLSLAAAVAVAFLNVAFATPAQAQVKAALTRDVDRPTAQPVNGKCSLDMGVDKCTLYTVPSGKRLVVEQVAYSVAVRTGGPIYELAFGLDTPLSTRVSIYNPNSFPVTPALQYDYLNVRTYSGSQALKIYLDENQVLAASVSLAPQPYVPVFAFTGYLVDK